MPRLTTPTAVFFLLLVAFVLTIQGLTLYGLARCAKGFEVEGRARAVRLY